MKRKLKLKGLALAAIMTVSAVSIPVQAVDEGCQHPHLSYVVETTYNCITNDYHYRYVDTGYKCDACGTWYSIIDSKCYMEQHDFNMNPSTGKFHCECGEYF